MFFLCGRATVRAVGWSDTLYGLPVQTTHFSILITPVTDQFALLKLDYKALQEKVTGLENHSRRSNLLFYGISQERCETDSDCLNKVYDLVIRQDYAAETETNVAPCTLQSKQLVSCPSTKTKFGYTLIN